MYAFCYSCERLKGEQVDVCFGYDWRFRLVVLFDPDLSICMCRQKEDDSQTQLQTRLLTEASS